MTEFHLATLTGAVAGLLTGVIITSLISHMRHNTRMAEAKRLADMEMSGLEDKLAIASRELETTHAELADVRQTLERLRDALADMEARKAAVDQAASRIPELEAAIATERNKLDNLKAVNLDLEKKLAQLTTRLEAERQQSEEKLALLNDARQRLTVEFKLLSDRILEEQGRSFSERSALQMDGLIGPLRQQLGDFKQRVEDVYDKESRDRAALRSEIGHLKHLNERIGQDALNLTNALKGDVKTLGNWGEVILERLLESSGLEKGRTYETQVSLPGGRGSRFQPDVIVRLPEGRDVIVDAKVSLKAYERFHSSADEDERAEAIKSHLASLRTHFKGLSGKHYEDLESVRSLDFVLMFVPVEAAFSVAMEHDANLFTDAFEKNVILVSPSSLMVTLRTIHNIWRYADQNENALEIARQAGGMYDKFVGFIEALEDVGRHLDRAKDAFRTVRDRLTAGRGNLVRRAEQLKALGVKANKALPEKFAGALDGDGQRQGGD